jgi:hypothetical protein
MKFAILTSYAFGVTATATMMAGCSSNGASSYNAPSGVAQYRVHYPRTISINGMLITAAHPNFGVRNHLVSLTPEKPNKKKTLYQYEATSSELLEFDYPKSDSPIGEVSSGAQGECTNVFSAPERKLFG